MRHTLYPDRVFILNKRAAEVVKFMSEDDQERLHYNIWMEGCKLTERLKKETENHQSGRQQPCDSIAGVLVKTRGFLEAIPTSPIR